MDPNHLLRNHLLKVIYQLIGSNRYTQDAGILPEVWLEYASLGPDGRVDLILAQESEGGTGPLALCLKDQLLRFTHSEPSYRGLQSDRPILLKAKIAPNRWSVAAALTLAEFIGVVIPFMADDRDGDLNPFKKGGTSSEPTTSYKAVVGLVDALQDQSSRTPTEGIIHSGTMNGEKAAWIARYEDRLAPRQIDPKRTWDVWPKIYRVSHNREARMTVVRSRCTVKADAVVRLFNPDISRITWAVVDSGIDHKHACFRRKGKDTQDVVVEAYDFTRLRSLITDFAAGNASGSLYFKDDKDFISAVAESVRKRSGDIPLTKNNYLRKVLRERVLRGRGVDWEILRPFLRVDLDDPSLRPKIDHGTHVAGILAGHEFESADGKTTWQGVCPGLRLFDIRVFGDEPRTDEYTVMAALQFIGHLNRIHHEPVIHGVNLSLSLIHAVAAFACGQTPVCRDCERLIAEGVVVVAAAGNDGHKEFMMRDGPYAGYQTVSITDPGNAEGVITVGATHRENPHTYGVSYFSSRGPTGDGRAKPDLVAPGEKIFGPTHGNGNGNGAHANGVTKDGTSMAAPHVSGAAALLLARYPELIGNPRRVKEILCSTATDLGRDRHFQGAGMLDLLRAFQSV